MVAAPSQQFYGRWARLYDGLSHFTPGIWSLRRASVAALDVGLGDTVVDMGCGTGPNVPHLRRAVGPGGRVIGVDFTGPVLDRARENYDYENVEFVQGDVTDLPLDEDVDAVFASFLSGMLPDPTGVVDSWTEQLGSGRRLGLLDAALSDKRIAWPLNQAVKAMVYASIPEKSRGWDTAPWTTVTQRVDLAHAEVHANTTEHTEQTWLLGTVRTTAGSVE